MMPEYWLGLLAGWGIGVITSLIVYHVLHEKGDRPAEFR